MVEDATRRVTDSDAEYRSDSAHKRRHVEN